MSKAHHVLVKRFCVIAGASPEHLQVTPQIFHQIQVWALAKPLQNFYYFLEEICLLILMYAGGHYHAIRCFSLSIILAEARRVLCQYWLVFGTVHNLYIYLNQDSSSSRMLPPPSSTVGSFCDVQCYLHPKHIFGTIAKDLNLFHQTITQHNPTAHTN